MGVALALPGVVGGTPAMADANSLSAPLKVPIMDSCWDFMPECIAFTAVRGYNQLIASKEHQQATFFFFMVKSMVSIHFTKHI
jgi:hypothetical protein